MIREFSGGKSLQLLKGDITKVPVDAIVNAANSELAGGGGVDGAIHAAGGPSLMQELTSIRASKGKCPAGRAVITTAGKLPAKYVFHAVGPKWQGGTDGEEELLASAYRSCLTFAEEKAIDYISFPSISTGVYGYPVDQASAVAMKEVVEHLAKENSRLRKVVFVLFDDRTMKAYAESLRTLMPA